MGRYRIIRGIGATPEQVFRAFADPALVADWMDAAGVAGATGLRPNPRQRGPGPLGYSSVARGAEDVA